LHPATSGAERHTQQCSGEYSPASSRCYDVGSCWVSALSAHFPTWDADKISAVVKPLVDNEVTIQDVHIGTIKQEGVAKLLPGVAEHIIQRILTLRCGGYQGRCSASSSSASTVL
jgi:hypothetical protein